MRLFIMGDSTMSRYDIRQYPLTGIGMALPLYLKPEVQVLNYAQSGTSTKSCIANGVPDKIRNEIRANDYLLIVFGHNDEKRNNPLVFTEPFGEYQENLRSFIELARNAGATPILATPLERRVFMDASNAWYDPSIPTETAYRLRPSAHASYAAAVKQVAEQENIALIDLTDASRRALEEAGPVASAKWYMNLAPGQYTAYPNGLLDNTHLTYVGAVQFAGLLANGLQALGKPYSDLLIESI